MIYNLFDNVCCLFIEFQFPPEEKVHELNWSFPTFDIILRLAEVSWIRFLNPHTTSLKKFKNIYIPGIRQGPKGVDPAVPVRSCQSQPGQGPKHCDQLPGGAGQPGPGQGPHVLPRHHPEDEGRVVQSRGWVIMVKLRVYKPQRGHWVCNFIELFEEG